MDNLCHSLVGAALSGAGFRRRTRFATATMVIGANLPDVDAAVYVFGGGTTALAFRRGWTHGVLAMVVLPLLLTVLMILIARAVDRPRAVTPSAATPPLVPAQVLVAAAISVWSHPLFDLLNTYGVRLLMPFSSRWFYGDTLFIVDPWVWVALGIGAVVSLRRARAVGRSGVSDVESAFTHAERPARIALIAVGVYIGLMASSSLVGSGAVERQAMAAGRPAAQRVMVGPRPLTPFSRDVVRDLGDSYETGRLDWTPLPRFTPDSGHIAKNLTRPAVRSAAGAHSARQFLSWARFPFAEVTGAGDTVRFDDARYARPGRSGFAGTTVAAPGRTGVAR